MADVSPGLSDASVIDLANREERVIVTFDKDFGELIFKEGMRTEGLILLRLAPTSPEQITRRLKQIITRQIPIKDKILVVREDRIRIADMR